MASSGANPASPRSGVSPEKCRLQREVLRRERAIHDFDLTTEAYRVAGLRDWAGLLDLGAVDPFLSELRVRRRHQGALVAVDRSSMQLGRLSQAACAAGASAISCIQADVAALPFQDECFDGVFCRHPLRSGLPPHHLFREIRRVVRPAGRVVFMLPSQVNYRLSREFLRRLALELPELKARTRPSWPLAEVATETLAPVFGPMQVNTLNEALYFQQLPDFLAFFDTFRDQFDPFPDDALWAEALRRVAGWAPAWFETRHAVSEPESTTILVATVL